MEHSHSEKLLELERVRTQQRERFIRINSQMEAEAQRVEEAKQKAVALLGTDNVDEINARIEKLTNSIQQRLVAMENQNIFVDTVLSALENKQPLNAEQLRILQHYASASSVAAPVVVASQASSSTSVADASVVEQKTTSSVTDLPTFNPLSAIIEQSQDKSPVIEAPVVVDSSKVITLEMGSSQSADTKPETIPVVTPMKKTTFF